MESMILAFISCLALSACVEVTRYTKLDGFEATFFRSLFSSLLLVPIVMFLPIPSELPFYFAAFLTATAYMYGTTVQTNLALQQNGRVAMMYQPIMVVLTFIGWFVIDPVQQEFFLTHKTLLYTVIGCFVVLFASLHFIRRNDYAWGAFWRVVPIGVLYAALSVMQKWLLDGSADFIGPILSFLFLVNLMMVLVSPLFARMRISVNERDFSSVADMRWGLLLTAALLNFVGMFCLIYAIAIARNPAFPVAISTLTPVCLMAYYYVRGQKDSASPLAGACMVASAFILALLTR